MYLFETYLILNLTTPPSVRSTIPFPTGTEGSLAKMSYVHLKKWSISYIDNIFWVLITMAVFLMKLAVNNLAVFLIKWQ